MKRLLFLTCCLTGLLGPVRAQDPDPSPATPGEEMEALRTLLQKWVETRQLISKERTEWETSRMIMTDQADLLREEIRILREKKEETATDLTGSEERKAELEAEVAEITDSMEGLEAQARPLELRVLALSGSLPRPLRSKLKPLLSRIPPASLEADSIDISLGERFQNAIGVLNEVNKYSREIHENNETRKLADGSNANVTVLYLGVSGALYVNPVSGVAGTGHPRADGNGWEWIERNDLVERFDTLIRMYRNETPAGYVALPFDQRSPEFTLPEEAPEPESEPDADPTPEPTPVEETP